MIKVAKLALLAALITGCSSPPPPVPVEWDEPARPLNSRIPQWNDNNVIVPSPVISGQWSSSISAYNFEDSIWTPAVFYAIAHSSRIVVTSQTGGSFFDAKNWLRRNGARGIIEYQPVFKCLTCRETTIYFSR
ncbi:Cag pathogenicity island protein Cag12 [Salmonella enterica]|nr:Cag pathogenicity island protein Cag12 [Salmonella enterica]